MFRSVALKLGAGAAAGAASSQLGRVSRADARPVRPVLPRAKNSAETSEKPQLEEDAWLEVSLNDDGVHFGRAEVSDAVEEIVGLCSNDENEENGGEQADRAIDASNSHARSSTYIARIMRASQRMVNHSGVQSAAWDAIQHDPELRGMIEELSNTRIELVNDWNGPLIAYDEATARRGRRRSTPLETMLEDIEYFLGKLVRGLKKAAMAVGRVVKAALVWLWNLVKKTARILSNAGGALDDAVVGLLPLGGRLFLNMGPAGRAAPIVLAGSMVLIVVMIIKRSLK